MDILPRTAIVIPCYNEAERIDGQTFLEYAKNNANVCFIFVNDGSTDNTAEIINSLTKNNPNQFMGKNLEHNYGKAEATRQGFLKAFRMNFDYIGFFDADLAIPLTTIINFCRALKPHNTLVVIGSRVRLLGRSIQIRRLRHYLGRIFAALASMVLGTPIYDTQCGAKLFKNNQLLKKVFSRPFRTKWIFDVEILGRYKLSINNTIEDHIIEYPLDSLRDIKGSKIKLLHFITAPFELLKIFVLLNSPSIINSYTKYFKNNTFLE